MPLLELVDETYVSAEVAAVAVVVHDPVRWGEWWPGLTLTPFMDRGDLGIRWSAVGAGWIGSIELWLEPVGDGVLVHHYQRLDPVGGSRRWSSRDLARQRDRRAREWKRQAFALKDALEGDRRPGTPVHPDGSRNRPGLPTLGG
jgi:hypothetical protein